MPDTQVLASTADSLHEVCLVKLWVQQTIYLTPPYSARLKLPAFPVLMCKQGLCREA